MPCPILFAVSELLGQKEAYVSEAASALEAIVLASSKEGLVVDHESSLFLSTVQRRICNGIYSQV